MSTSKNDAAKQPKSEIDPVELIEVYDLYQKREQIYTRSFQGIFRNFRVFGGYLLFLIYFGTAWINMEGQQAILWDLPERKFHILGTIFWPQDFMLLSWGLIICAFALFFVTVWAGRVWCGYTCPQSVYTWIFMWVEKHTEGERNQRIKLDKAPMSANKFLRKSAKHGLWLLISLATAITFVGYFTPIREFIPQLLSLDVGGWALFWIGFLTLATYGNAGWLREQVCNYMCPYARFQSVMFDQDTLIISYDKKRGESRGKRKRDADYKAEGLGDCIDCNVCVNVCPVGIDIRDGLQMECIGCAACVDGCNEIMDLMGYERGLVSYTTEHNLEGGKSQILRPRLIGYFIALCVMIAAVVVTVQDRVPLSFEVLRDRNTLFSETVNGQIQNVYTLKIANMSKTDHRFKVSVTGLKGVEISSLQNIVISSGKVGAIPLRLQIEPELIKQRNSDISFHIEAENAPEISAEQDSRFIGPIGL